MRCVNWFVWFVALVGETVTLTVAVISFLSMPLFFLVAEKTKLEMIFQSPVGAIAFYWMFVAWFIVAGICHYVRRSLEK